MAASPVTQQPRHGERRSLAATIAIALIASSAVFGLLVSGMTFLALAVAFQIAVRRRRCRDAFASRAILGRVTIPSLPTRLVSIAGFAQCDL